MIHFDQNNIVCPNSQKCSPFLHRVMALKTKATLLLIIFIHTHYDNYCMKLMYEA